MRVRGFLLLVSLAMTLSCTGARDAPAAGAATSSAAGAVQPGATTWVEGKDYTVLERARFMDDDGFTEPAEAFSVLLPRGWTHEGGVAWKGPQTCRGEMVSANWSAASADGEVRFRSLPVHAWGWASEPMMLQSLHMQAQQGGCEVGTAMDAEQYLRQVLAPRELQGATVIDVRDNPEATAALQEQIARNRAQLEGMGAQVEVVPSAIIARLRWEDGTEGIALCSVLNIMTTMQNPYTGAMQRLSNSNASERSWLRFPAARRAEAETVLANLKSSFRTNPQWQGAIDGYFRRMRQQDTIVHHQRMQALADQTAANARAHAQRMADIQARGAANTQRFEQRMSDMDRSLRSWESQQASQDRMHTAFVQGIREVETWQGGNGSVELSSGYGQAWSRGDGTYIMSNSPSFDPRAAFQDQNWQELTRAKP